jgi:hypothetical protein
MWKYPNFCFALARGIAALLLAGALGQAWATPPDGTDQGDGDARIFARARPSGPERPETAPGPALDHEGNVYVADRGERDIRKIDLAGHATLHARLPERTGPSPREEDEGPPDGILAMTLDPATGELQAEDRSGLWRVSASGEVTAVEQSPVVSSTEAPPPEPQPAPATASKPGPGVSHRGKGHSAQQKKKRSARPKKGFFTDFREKPHGS